jgi:hypothetical protein
VFGPSCNPDRTLKATVVELAAIVDDRILVHDYSQQTERIRKARMERLHDQKFERLFREGNNLPHRGRNSGLFPARDVGKASRLTTLVI